MDKKPTLKRYEMIYNSLLKKIKNGELKNGDRIPTEMELTKIFNVSRITAMNAVKLLEARGFVVRKKKSGTFVNLGKVFDRQIICPIILPYSEDSNSIISGAQDFGLGINCAVPFHNSFNKIEKEREILKKYIKAPPDGLMIYPCSTFENVDLISKLHSLNVPMIFIDREILGSDGTLVASNNAKAMFTLVNNLIQRNYRRFGYFGLNKHMFSSERARFTGFCLALSGHKLNIDTKFLYQVPDNLDDAINSEKEDPLKKIAHNIISDIKNLDDSKRPEVICCVSDFYALTLLQCALESGITVPDELSITGFDNIEHSQKIIPSLTTIGQNFYEIGRSALDTLYKNLRGETCSKRIRVDTMLHFRESTK